jgi:5'(3')-deoxyribonucleotidase
MDKKRLYVDMDGVLADFIGSYKKYYNPITNKFPQSNWGFFANLDPIENGVETVKELMEHYDVWILTRASYKNPLCYTEKRIWIEKYFDLEFCNKLIICPNKSLVKGDYLIDDCLTDGQTEFEGELVHFGRSHVNWGEVSRYLIGHKIHGDEYKTDITLNIEEIERREEYDKECDWRQREIELHEEYEQYANEQFGPAEETSGWYMDDEGEY